MCPPCAPHVPPGDALYAMELALSLEKLNFDKLMQLWEVGAGRVWAFGGGSVGGMGCDCEPKTRRQRGVVCADYLEGG